MAVRLIFAFGLAALIASSYAGDCGRNTNGTVVRGRGQCMLDSYGKVFCAREGGGAIREQYGTVVCGIDYCAADDPGRVKCSTRPAGVPRWTPSARYNAPRNATTRQRGFVSEPGDFRAIDARHYPEAAASFASHVNA